jgi:hypothetical protein
MNLPIAQKYPTGKGFRGDDLECLMNQLLSLKRSEYSTLKP